MTSHQAELPLHLDGNNAPVLDEVVVDGLVVEGTLPESLEGTFVRNGPNPQTGWSLRLRHRAPDPRHLPPACRAHVRRDGAGAARDDVALITFAHDRADDRSYVLVLDANDVAAGPVARILLPVRVPGGFHGTWLPHHRRF